MLLQFIREGRFFIGSQLTPAFAAGILLIPIRQLPPQRPYIRTKLEAVRYEGSEQLLTRDRRYQLFRVSRHELTGNRRAVSWLLRLFGKGPKRSLRSMSGPAIGCGRFIPGRRRVLTQSMGASGFRVSVCLRVFELRYHLAHTILLFLDVAGLLPQQI